VIQGVIADHVGIHHAFFLPVLCYLYILFYGLRGIAAEQRAVRQSLNETKEVPPDPG